jgi:hypothetical protein
MPGAEALLVSVIRAHPTPRGAGHLLRAAVAAWLLVLVLVVPVGAVEGPTRLFDPSVTPTTPTPTTLITITVEYRNREGSAPAYVRAVIDGTAHDMTGDGGDDWRKGVSHQYTTKLPAGTHQVSFVAAAARKFSDEVDGGTITVTVVAATPPAPAPTPNPAPDPTPAPKSTPAPALNGTPTSGGGGGGGTATDGTGGATGTGGAEIDARGTGAGWNTSIGFNPGYAPASSTAGGPGSGSDGGIQTWGDGLNGLGGDSAIGADRGANPTGGIAVVGAAAFGGAGEAEGPAGPGSTTADGGTRPLGTGGFSGSAGSTGSGGSWGALAAALDVLGIDGGSAPLTAMPTLVGTTGAVAMAMAFAIFGKKRRDEEQPAPDEVLHANAAQGGMAPASAALVGGVVAAAVAVPIDLEASIPRWRRPSLQQARKADPTRYMTTTPKMRFDEADAAVIGYERRLIRYHVVRLLDAPDELRSVEIGQLDQGDEVQLLEKSGAYWLVRCPDGRQGWLHKMTLGDTVGESAESAAEAWNVGDIDGDVLSAFLAARARA